MSDLDDFLKEHNLTPAKSRKSVLAPYADEILRMREMGFAEKIILQFLKEKKGVSVSQQTLNWFIRNRSGKSTPTPVTHPTKAEMTETANIPAVSGNQETTGIAPPRRFNWKTPPSREELLGKSK